MDRVCYANLIKRILILIKLIIRGNYLKKEKEIPDLIFFSAINCAELKNEQISALQSIETAMFLIGMQRWPNVIPLFFESLEKLIKAELGFYKNPNERKNAEDLFDNYLLRYPTSPALSKCFHSLRKFRNSIIHDGFSPKDDIKVIEFIFNAAIPCLDHIFKNKFQATVFEIIAKVPTQDWIADAYKKTRKVVAKKLNKNTECIGKNLYAAVFPMRLVIQRIQRSGKASNRYNTASDTEILLSEFYWIENDIKLEIYNSFLNELKKIGTNSLLILLDDFTCLGCHKNSIVANIEFNGDHDHTFEHVSSYGCCWCQYSILDRDVCDVFINEVLDENQIKKIENMSLPDAFDCIPEY